MDIVAPARSAGKLITLHAWFALTHRLIGLADFNDHRERLVGGILLGCR